MPALFEQLAAMMAHPELDYDALEYSSGSAAGGSGSSGSGSGQEEEEEEGDGSGRSSANGGGSSSSRAAGAVWGGSVMSDAGGDGSGGSEADEGGGGSSGVPGPAGEAQYGRPSGRSVLYVTGEETEEQVYERCVRMGLGNCTNLYVLAASELNSVLGEPCGHAAGRCASCWAD